LLRSAFSAAANYRAACKAQSKKAFSSKLSMAFEEIDESCFWLESITDLQLLNKDIMVEILTEGDQLARILASSRKTTQSRLKS
jgi:four helix bundle protein